MKKMGRISSEFPPNKKFPMTPEIFSSRFYIPKAIWKTIAIRLNPIFTFFQFYLLSISLDSHCWHDQFQTVRQISLGTPESKEELNCRFKRDSDHQCTANLTQSPRVDVESPTEGGKKKQKKALCWASRLAFVRNSSMQFEIYRLSVHSELTKPY